MRPAVLLAVALLLPSGGCGDGGEVPTYRVEARPFEHRVTAEGLLRAAQATKLTVPPEVQATVRLAWLAEEGSRVAAGDVVARFDPKAMEQRLEDGRADLRSASLEMDKAEVRSDIEIARLEKELAAAEIELDHARRFQKTDDQVFSRRDIAEDAIDEQLAEERKEHARVSAGTQASLKRTEQELLAIQRRKAQLIIDQATSGLRGLEVRAPHAGILTLVRNWRGEPPAVGAEMWGGQEIAEIPELSTMEAEVYVLEADAGGLAEGKAAEVVVEAHPDAVHRAEIGRVEAVAKPRFRGSPVQYFGVVLDFERTDPETMKPGQRVRATLVLASLEDALVVPRQAVFQEGGASRVYVRRGGGFEPREVRLGPMSMGLVVVEEGLRQGDEVALRRPTDGAPDDAPEADAAGPVEAAGASP